MAISPVLQAKIPTIQAKSETTPIPAGLESSDDAAIWLHPTNSSKSLVLGVSKNKIKDGGKPGLGVYDLEGKEKQYIYHDRLNNVDVRYNIGVNGNDIAAASNRDKKAISIFEVNASGATLKADLPITTGDNLLITEEPYGFCLGRPMQSGKLFAFSPMKSGLIYQHEIHYNEGKYSTTLVNIIDTASYLDEKTDQYLIEIILKETIWEEDLPTAELIQELSEDLAERHQLEGCVFDDEKNQLYFGMENLGIFKINLKNIQDAKLIAKVQKAKSEPNSDILNPDLPRVINDVEGMSLHLGPNGKGALIVSIQGLDEYAFFDRKDDSYIGSFKVDHGRRDPVTETDGLDLLSAPLGQNYPFGILVLHDHHNTNINGEILRANYKIVSLGDVFEYFPSLRFENFVYDPRL